MSVKYQVTKSIQPRVNGRSADITSGNFVLGCGFDSKYPCSYCYEQRWNRPKTYINTNTDDILMACHDWVEQQVFPKIPNQCGKTYYYVDISCNTDLARAWIEVNGSKI